MSNDNTNNEARIGLSSLNAGLGIISPMGIVEFDKSDKKLHLYAMTDGSRKRLTLRDARRLLIADGAAPFLLGAPKEYMPNDKA